MGPDLTSAPGLRARLRFEVSPTTVVPMKIGVLGATGPAGSGLAARLASVGFEVILGSRSKYRAMEVRDKIVQRWPDKELLLEAGDNHEASGRARASAWA